VISITVFVRPPGYDLRMARYALFLILTTGLCAGGVRHAAGQTQPPVDESPRIGLVLSGGGARGAAHVGVLRVLEEHDVPVHAIAGTSMGAIVGSMYAAGWAPDEIEAQLATIDWNAMLTDRLPREHLSFRRREEDREFLTQFELGVDRGRPRQGGTRPRPSPSGGGSRAPGDASTLSGALRPPAACAADNSDLISPGTGPLRLLRTYCRQLAPDSRAPTTPPDLS
jgi:hypothetical protein